MAEPDVEVTGRGPARAAALRVGLGGGTMLPRNLGVGPLPNLPAVPRPGIASPSRRHGAGGRDPRRAGPAPGAGASGPV